MSDTPEKPETIELLDAYLRRLQAGERPDREAMLRENPELASMLDCLETLEDLAPLPGSDHTAGCGPFDDTLPQIPRDFGAYELLEEIGRGGMGVVYKARQQDLDRMVAIKMILASYLASADHVRRFQDEARAAARLRHSNIVQIHEVGQCHGQHYFTMEYIEGSSLAERIAQGPIDAITAARLVEQVARAVQHLHEHGIVHRDLKPSNILLDNQDQPYVTDFGLAKFFASDSKATATGVIAGTPSYMSPEQAAGQNSRIGPAADVYSLGAILYELLTRRPPYQEENPLDTLLQVLGGEPIPPRQLDRRVPRELEWICLKCLARSPTDRYASAAALADDLDRFLKRDVLEAKPPGLLQKFWSWARRRPALVSRLGTLAAFYVDDRVHYFLTGADADFHRQMSLLILTWALTAIVCQQFLASRRWSIPARLIWGVLDSSLLLVALLIANGVVSPLVVGYFLLIVASGLWYRVRFVWVMTGLSLASYAVLIFDYYHWRDAEFRATYPIEGNQHAVFVLAMLALASVTAYLVARIRALSNYYGQKL